MTPDLAHDSQVDIRHIRDMAARDLSRRPRMLPKLTEEVLTPNQWTKMRVR